MHSTSRGKKTAAREADEKSREFKKGQRFRAGIGCAEMVLVEGESPKCQPDWFIPSQIALSGHG
jgi:hypothetical protein